MQMGKTAFLKEVLKALDKSEAVTVYLLMVWKHTIGQEKTKNHLSYLLESNQVPHAQLFNSICGRGGLVLAIEFALKLLKVSEDLKEIKTLGEICQNPNLHFIYPVVKRGNEKLVYSSDYISEWYEFLNEMPYGNYTDWFDHIAVGNKQGIISVSEIEKLHQSLYLKAFGGGNKVCVLWGLEKINTAAANAFLKLLEEPPNNTYFILLCESDENVLPTVLSRCQEITLGPIEEYALARMIPENQDNNLQLLKQAGGNYGKLLSLISDKEEKIYEAFLVQVLRAAFKAKGNKNVVVDLMSWANELALLGREKQKAFLRFGIQFFRDAFLKNYRLDELVHHKSETGFEMDKLAPFIHSENILELTALFEKQHYYIQRNANAKMMFAEMSLQLTRLINIPKPK
jgi:DNA polymerase-3 subunit delta'